MKRDTKQKVLLLLSAGVALSMARTPRNYFKILKNMPKEWEKIKRNRLYRVVKEFYQERLVSFKENKEGFAEIVLTKEGENKALRFKIDEMEIKNRPNGTVSGGL